MAYTTGVVSTPANLKSAIESFAVVNGWTLSSGTLSKGSVRVQMTTTTSVLEGSGINSAYYSDVFISGSRTSTFSTPDLCPQQARTRIRDTAWPVTYWLFVNTSPDEIWCVVNYGGVYFQYISFGYLQKQGTWTGGDWFASSYGTNNAENGMADIMSFTPTSSGQAYVHACAPFWGTYNRPTLGDAYYNIRNSFLHCELEGHIWPGAGSSYVGRGSYPFFPTHAYPLHSFRPNTWNHQAVMIPFWLFFQGSDGYEINVGQLGHIRSVNVEFYNPGDIITLGPDQWMVFPWRIKDTVHPDGDTNSSGLYGYAVRYTP